MNSELQMRQMRPVYVKRNCEKRRTSVKIDLGKRRALLH